MARAPGSDRDGDAGGTQDLFRVLVEGVQEYAIFMLDPEGRVASWNAGAERINGWRVEEILGRSSSVFYTEADVRLGKPAWDLERAQALASYQDEGWRVRKDGSLFWADVVITALRDPQGRLRGFAKVTRDLTERRHAADERRRLALAREAVAARDEFLAVASHEMKTPVTSLQIEAQALRRWTRSAADVPDAQRRRVERLAEDAARLASLVQNLAGVAELAAGPLEIRREPLDLRDLTVDALRRWADVARSVGVEILLEAPWPVTGMWDRARLADLLDALLDNALKWGLGRPVRIEVARLEQGALVAVTDQGTGIPAEDQARIFEPFERAVPVSHFGGFGLGLWVARRIAEAHGGEVSVQSAPGRGARFTVVLPSPRDPSRGR